MNLILSVRSVLEAFGAYRAALTILHKRTVLKENKVSTPIFSIGGDKGLGPKVAQMVEAVVASNVVGELIPECGHLVPEEWVRLLHGFAAKTSVI